MSDAVPSNLDPTVISGDADALEADDPRVVKRLTTAMREADNMFQGSGGSTRHYVRECLLPMLKKHNLSISCVD